MAQDATDRRRRIAHMAIACALSAACEELLRLYAGAVNKGDLARLHLLRLSSDMRESYWGFLQLGISRIEFDYAKYAREHLERFLRNQASPDVPRWLTEVGR